jgi:hypothetical protein
MIEEGRVSSSHGTGNGISSNGGSGYQSLDASSAITVPLSFNDGPDSDTSVETASMMKASRSTLDFSQMAHTSSRRQAQANANKGSSEETFQFKTPSQFPPRDA